MRHLRSILYALVLAPAVWILSGVGFTHDLTGRARDYGGVETLTGLSLLLLAGAAYAILLLSPISPAGPALFGVFYLGISVWALTSPISYHGVWPASVVKDGFDLSLPGYGLAALLALPLICTALSSRRWERYEPPEIPLIGVLGRPRGAATVAGTTPIAAVTTEVFVRPGARRGPGGGAEIARDGDPTQVIRLPDGTVKPPPLVAAPDDRTTVLPSAGAVADPDATIVAAPSSAAGAKAGGDKPELIALESAAEAGSDGDATQVVEPDAVVTDDDATQAASPVAAGAEPETEAMTPAAGSEEPEIEAVSAAAESKTEVVELGSDDRAGTHSGEEATEAVVEEPTVVEATAAVEGQPEPEAPAEDEPVVAAHLDEPTEVTAPEEKATVAEDEPIEAGPVDEDKTQVIKLPTSEVITRDLGGRYPRKPEPDNHPTPSNDRTQVVPPDHDEDTQVIRVPQRGPQPADARPGRSADIPRSRPTGGRGTGSDDGERTQVIRLGSGSGSVEPPGDRTQVIRLPVQPPPAGPAPAEPPTAVRPADVNADADAAADPTPAPSIVAAERPDPGADPTTRINSHPPEPSPEAAANGKKRIMTVTNLERPADEAADDTRRLVTPPIPGQRRPDDDETA